MGVESFLIVGSGVFGASTALHLAQVKPGVEITLVDRFPFPSPASASTDLNKIIRTDYDDIFYMRLALKAQALWRSDELYSRFYHSEDHIYVEDEGLGKQILRHYEELEIQNGAKMISVADLKQNYSELFADTGYQNVEQVFMNPSSGWAEAASSLTAVIESAIAKGVRYIRAEVTKLSYNDYGGCNGVYTACGQKLVSRNTILATGAGTTKLLSDSSHRNLKFHVEERILSAGVVSGNLKLNQSQTEKFRSVPIFVHDLGSPQGEVLPLSQDSILKIASETSFKNTVRDASGTVISIPPDIPASGQWSVPKDLQDECRTICSDIFGSAGDELQFESYRICWDCITADGDFVISGHPECRGLYFAFGGSFHSWKFLPILGEYVVKLILGQLEPELERRWTWTRDMGNGSRAGLWPTREWKDFQ